MLWSGEPRTSGAVMGAVIIVICTSEFTHWRPTGKNWLSFFRFPLMCSLLPFKNEGIAHKNCNFCLLFKSGIRSNSELAHQQQSGAEWWRAPLRDTWVPAHQRYRLVFSVISTARDTWICKTCPRFRDTVDRHVAKMVQPGYAHWKKWRANEPSSSKPAIYIFWSSISKP